MIRDPSDGSVKDVRHQPKPLETKPYASEKPVLSTASGLPFGSTKPEHIERLERSRKQLEQFRRTGVWDDAT